jgi:hypothetical protein
MSGIATAAGRDRPPTARDLEVLGSPTIPRNDGMRVAVCRELEAQVLNATRRKSLILSFSIAITTVAACHDDRQPPPPGPSDDRTIGQTDFTNIEGSSTIAPGTSTTGAAGGTGNAGTGNAGAADRAGAPSGRVAEVQEADIYKLVGTRLYYFNTYRGFIVYDVADSSKPVQLSRLPVYGYPIEMFVEGNVVYALLRESLYLTQASGKLQFQRHNVSQLVSIDVSDVANPKVLKTLDIIGDLREGVSRKIDKTIYVVSEQYQGYYWGWPSPNQTNEAQAWVYSYDVSDPTNPRQVGQLSIFKGNGEMVTDAAGNITSQRWFSGVAISATSNALMVVEHWSTSRNDPTSICSWSSSEDSVVSVIDVSDPTGVIRRHTRFQAEGTLDDQFKMTYRYDDATARGIFFGIFFSQSWNCGSGSVTSNRLESWDITDGDHPARVGSLAFGKPGEAVRGSTYDLSRNVAYAITARQIDPLYAIDISNPAALRVLSEIDGLSGSVSVFRTVGGGQFLLGVGQDQSTSCNGPQDGDPNWLNTRMALSIIDVRDLTRIRLAQRGCVSIKGAGWSWSSINWNLDQAHKMLGMFQDGDVNILTVPVSYYTQDTLDVGWWYHWKTAVGILTWDLSRYDDSKPPEQQTVVQNYGTFVHPEGEVKRSVLFRHPTTQQRTMINLSDTHLSVAGIADLANPQLQSIVEVAPPVNEVYAFGSHVVERVDQGGYWSPNGVAEFRVKQAGGPIDDKTPAAKFQIGQTGAVYRYKDNLVVMRQVVDPTGVMPVTSEAVVVDLADPARPRIASRLAVPFQSYGYYGFYCGVGFWGGYWFGSGAQNVITADGLVEVGYQSRYNGTQYSWSQTLSFLDLRDINAPKVSQVELPTQDTWGSYSVVADPAMPNGFYLARRDYLGQVTMGTSTFARHKYFAQRYQTGTGALVAGDSINLPGPLARTWVDGGGVRWFMISDQTYRTVQYPDHSEWHGDTRLNLLKQSGKLAELTATRTFADMSLSSFVIDAGRMYVSGQNLYYWWGYPDVMAANPPTWESTSDRLMIFDIAAGKLTSLYDQPTRTYNVRLMGMHQGRLFVSLPGDGVLAANVTDPASPQGLKFLRTLGWGTGIEFSGNDAYVPSGSFGVFNLDLTRPAAIPTE